MEREERIENARKVLGDNIKIIKRRAPGTKQKTRPVSTYTPRKTKGKRNMSRAEYKQCGKKTRYPDEADARKYAAHLSKVRGYPIRAYYCKFCGGFHLTHKPYKSRRPPVNTERHGKT